MVQSDDPRAADVFDFVDAYAAAQERGEDPPLAFWLGRFPASQAAVAHEWLALRSTEERAAADGARPTPPPGPDRIGPYRLIRELGRGGQGAVFLAEDTRILRRVALKVLASRFDTIRDDKLRRFRREAEIIARLEHQSLCTVYEADLEGDTPYIAMRFVEGSTLADVLQGAKQVTGTSDTLRVDTVRLDTVRVDTVRVDTVRVDTVRVDTVRVDTVRLDTGDETTPRSVEAHFPPRTKLELDQVLVFFERAARALHAAHEAGVVHRDVKPGNVIVAADGKPVILDFGLARDESEAEGARITESGEVFGTPSYMSPEQLELASDLLDRRTDVYSLGVALYEALTLHRPFEAAARPALYLAIQSQPPPDPRGFNASLPEDVVVVLATALEKDRARRYATALDFAEDLRRIRQYEPIRARPASLGLRFARWIRRHPALAAATIGTIVSLTAGLAVALDLLAAEKRAVTAKDLAIDEKDAALSIALGKHLSQRSIELAEEDAGAALALGILGAERAPGYQTLSALYPALENCWLERVLEGDDSGPMRTALMTALAIDPLGRFAIGAFPGGAAHVWHLATAERVALLTPGHGDIDVIAVDAAGERVALAASDGTITIARLDGGATLGQVVGAVATGQRTTRLCFSPDGARLLARAATGVVRLVDPEGLRVLATSNGPHLDARWGRDQRVLLFGFAGFEIVPPDAESRLVGSEHPWGRHDADAVIDVTPDGSWFARANEGEIEIRDADGRVSSRARAPASPVRTLALSPRGEHIALACGSEDSASAWIQDFRGAAVRLEIPGKVGISRIVWSPGGERVAVVLGDTAVRVFDAATGAASRAFALSRRQIDAAWTPDGSRLVTATSGSAYVWFASARPDTFDLARHADAVRSLGVSADGARVLSASADGTAHLVDLREAAFEPLRARTFVHGAPLFEARFVAHGALIATAGEDGVVRAFDAERSTVVAATAPFAAGIAALAAHERSQRVAIVTGDGAAFVFDAGTGAMRSASAALAAGAVCVSATFLSDGAQIAFGTADGVVVVVEQDSLDLVARHVFGRPDALARGIVALDASAAGELAVGSSDRFVRFWRPGEEAESRPERFVFHLRRVAWDPRGERVLALRHEPGTKAVRVLHAETGDSAVTHDAHRGAITCAAFTDDGSVALSGASDGSIFAWSARDGAPIVQRADLGAAVSSLAFVRLPSGASVVAGLADGRIRVWPLDPLAAARARRPRDLADWEQKRERLLAAPLPFD